MRNWILGGFLACFTTAGIAYVLAKNSVESYGQACIEKTESAETASPILPPIRTSYPDSDSESCEQCKPKADASLKVVDVVDLDRTIQIADGSKPPMSFEEPPLAKPRVEVTRVVFEEIAPMPRVEQINPQGLDADRILAVRSNFKWVWTIFGDPISPEVAPMPREVK